MRKKITYLEDAQLQEFNKHRIEQMEKNIKKIVDNIREKYKEELDYDLFNKLHDTGLTKLILKEFLEQSKSYIVLNKYERKKFDYENSELYNTMFDRFIQAKIKYPNDFALLLVYKDTEEV